jgi:hypothetical protein
MASVPVTVTATKSTKFGLAALLSGGVWRKRRIAGLTPGSR